MRRLDFVLPDFCRVSWSSDHAKQLILPKIEAARKVLSTLELTSVQSGLRRCALVALPAASYTEEVAKCGRAGHSVVPLSDMVITGSYVSTIQRAGIGTRAIWSVVGNEQDVIAAQAAYVHSDSETLGGLLGYPLCCVKFFERTWQCERYIDTTWPMVKNSVSLADDLTTSVRLEVPATNNILMRWIGVRPVFHLPCSFFCEPTAHVAKAFEDLACSIDAELEIQALYEILRLPAEWSALHGIAEIVTPHFKIAARTDATPDKLTVQINPEAACRSKTNGLKFPFSSPRSKLRSAASITLTEDPIESDYHSMRWFHEDNGFRSLLDMERCHQPLVKAITKYQPNHVLDLGCGNGALLRKVIEIQSVVPYGIEFDGQKVTHAQLLHSGYAANFKVGNLFDLELLKEFGQIDVTLLMLGRLTEVPRLAAETLLAHLQLFSSSVIAYVYPGWQGEPHLSEIANEFRINLDFSSADSQNVATIKW